MVKWLIALYVLSFVAALLALTHREKVRQLRHFFQREQIKPRTSADAVTPVMKDLDRHEQFLARIKEGDIEVLFLGDSITDLWPKVGEWSWLRLARFKPANFGVGGDRTEHLLWRITQGELEGINPKVVVILIGTNNLGAVEGEKPAWVTSALRRIVQNVQQHLPTTKILLLGIFPRDQKTSPLRQAVAEVNASLSQLANGSQIRFEDFGRSFLDSNGDIPTDVMADGLHLTARGYEIWLANLEPVLEEMTK